jgi:CheY-like chemotaxis protein
VAVISGSDDPPARRAALAAGAVTWLDKPFRLAEVRSLADSLPPLLRQPG